MKNKRLLVSYIVFFFVVAAADVLSPAPFAAIPTLGHELIALSVIFGLVFFVGWRASAAALLGFSVVCCGWAIYQVFLYGWRPLSGIRPSAIFGSSNYLGGFVALCVFLAILIRPPKAVLAATISVNMLSLILSDSRAAIMALFFGLFWIAPARWRWAWLASPLGAAIILGLHGATGTTGRIKNLVLGISDFMYRPFLGWGQDSPHPSTYVHYYNIGIEWLVSAGIVGFAVFVWCAIETIVAAYRLPKSLRNPMLGLLTAYLVNGMAIYDTAGTSAVLLIAMSALMSLHPDESNRTVVQHDDKALLERGRRKSASGGPLGHER